MNVTRQRSNMKSDQFHQLVLTGATSSLAVTVVFVVALLSIFVVQSVKSIFLVLIQLLAFVFEVVVAVVAAITSGSTITMSLVVAAVAAAISFPASSIQARVGLSMAVSSAATVASATAVLCFTTMRIETEIAFAVISAAAMSVAFAAAWAVGVMSLIEKETHSAGLKMMSVLDTVRRNNCLILRLLLKLHMGSTRRDLDIALLHAVKAGYKECTKVLLEAGADPDAHDTNDNTPLMLACETGAYDIAELLVLSGANIGLHHNGGRGTALHRAANWGSVECIRLLVSKSADPNSVDVMQRTPLMLAAMHAHNPDTVLQMLINAGSDVNATGPERKTALHMAAARGINTVVLLDAGANSRSVDSAGNTALHEAAGAGHGLAVRTLLIDGRSDPRAWNDQRRTPLHLAASHGDVECLSTIVEISGPDVCFMVDVHGHQPVWYSAHHGHYEATVFFIQINGPPFTNLSLTNLKSIPLRATCPSVPVNQNPSSPLQAALDKCHVHVARALLLGGCGSRELVNDWLVGVNERHLKELLDNDKVEHVDWLEKFAHAPCELGQQCRLAIRNVLGTRALEAARRLPLPKKLQQFVLVADLIIR